MHDFGKFNINHINLILLVSLQINTICLNVSANERIIQTNAHIYKSCSELSLLMQYITYSKVSIIRPGCSRLLKFEKNICNTGSLTETFSKYPDQVV